MMLNDNGDNTTQTVRQKFIGMWVDFSIILLDVYAHLWLFLNDKQTSQFIIYLFIKIKFKLRLSKNMKSKILPISHTD